MSSPISFQSALSAYKNANTLAENAAKGIGPGLQPQESNPASFGNMVKDSVAHMSTTLNNAEQVSSNALMKKASLTDVVGAVTSAELTLQAVIAVRDRLVGSLQEIMRMPI